MSDVATGETFVQARDRRGVTGRAGCPAWRPPFPPAPPPHVRFFCGCATDGSAFAGWQLLAKQGIIPGIKVDKGLVPLPFSNGESWCQGLDGLAGRAASYYKQARGEREGRRQEWR